MNEDQAKSLENIEEALTKDQDFVSWRVFAATVSAVVLIGGAIVSYLMSQDAKAEEKLSKYETSSVQIQTQLSQIQTDLAWIKLQLTNQK